jgi:hypothetical protein
LKISECLFADFPAIYWHPKIMINRYTSDKKQYKHGYYLVVPSSNLEI